MTAADVDDHAPGRTDSAGRPRCEACGYIWPCPDVRNAPAPLTADDKALLEAVEVATGFTVWRRAPEGSELDRDGGIVVGVYDLADGDGEAVRHVRVVDAGRGMFAGRPVWHVIPLADIDPRTIALPNAGSVRARVRLIARWVSEQRGVVSGEELEALADALTLARSIA